MEWRRGGCSKCPSGFGEHAAGAGVQGRRPCLEAVGTVNTVKPRPRKHGRNDLNDELEGKSKFARPCRACTLFVRLSVGGGDNDC